MKCRKYVIATIYLRQGGPWTRTLRTILGLGGRIVSKDEAARRVVFEASPSRLLGILEGIGQDVLEGGVLEAKAVCRVRQGAGALMRGAAGKVYRRGPVTVGYGVVAGRIVFLEARGPSLIVKAGRRTRASVITSPPPPSALSFTLEEAEEAIEAISQVLEGLRVVSSGAEYERR